MIPTKYNPPAGGPAAGGFGGMGRPGGPAGGLGGMGRPGGVGGMGRPGGPGGPASIGSAPMDPGAGGFGGMSGPPPAYVPPIQQTVGIAGDPSATMTRMMPQVQPPAGPRQGVQQLATAMLPGRR